MMAHATAASVAVGDASGAVEEAWGSQGSKQSSQDNERGM